MKVLSLNTWQERGPWKPRWELIFENLSEIKPDLIGFQEVFNSDWAHEVKHKTGFSYLVFHPEPSGLMLLSKYSVIESQCLTYETKSPQESYFRYALYARLELEKTKHLLVFNTHFSWLPDESYIRQAQAKEFLAFIHGKLNPEVDEQILLMGDFNATEETSEVQLITEAGFTDSFRAKNPKLPGLTWHNDNSYARMSSVPLPDRRIDYIFLKGGKSFLKALQSVEVVLQKRSSTGIWCSDHYGVLASFGPIF